MVFFFQAEDGIRDLVRSRGLGDVYKRQGLGRLGTGAECAKPAIAASVLDDIKRLIRNLDRLSLIHI